MTSRMQNFITVGSGVSAPQIHDFVPWVD